MDATVPQRDGYRFVYLLPFSPTRLLVEDTYYADRGDLDVETLRGHLADYAAAAKWGEGRLVREEHGILPIALGGDIDALIAAAGGMPTVGLAHALFHPTTGYSLPDAVHVADLVSRARTSRRKVVASSRCPRAQHLVRPQLFPHAEPASLPGRAAEERYRILEHFHRLPEDLVARFYAARLDFGDKVRILAGKPPVPVLSALRVLAARRPKETA